MNNLIERYVYDVVRRLPEKMRDEVAEELRGNIEDMLSLQPSDEEITKVLEKLGHPRTLANSYREKSRFLIGPEWFEDYLMVLKIVMIVFAAIALVSSVISNTLNPEATTVFGIITEVFFKTIAEIVSSLFQAFALVTFIFFMIEKYNGKGKKSHFDIKFLPELPDKKTKEISKVGTMISLILNVVFGFIFVYLLYKNQMLVGWFNGDGEFVIIANVFNSAVVRPLIPIIIVSVVFNVALDIFKLIEGKWTIRVAFGHTVVKVVAAIITIIFLTQSNLFHVELIQSIADALDISATQVGDSLHMGMIGLSVLVGLGSFADVVTTWTKQFNLKEKLHQ